MNRLRRIARQVLAKLPDSAIDKLRLKYGISATGIANVENRIADLNARNPDTVVEWALFLLNQRKIRGQEDFPRLVSTANFFFANSGTPRFREVVEELGLHPQNLRNLFSYSLHDLEEVQGIVLETSSDRAERERLNKLENLPPGAKTIYNKNGLQIVEVRLPAAACQLAKGTKWCTSNPKTAESYLEESPLYIIYEKGRKHAQLHTGTGYDFQIMDLRDRRIDIDVPMATAFRELGWTERLLRTLMRVEVNEPSPWKIRTFTTLFNHGFSPDERKRFEGYMARSGHDALEFARATETPFPAGEPAIARKGYLSESYAINVLHDRFPLGEPAILDRIGSLEDYVELLHSIGKFDEFERDHPEAFRNMSTLQRWRLYGQQ